MNRVSIEWRPQSTQLVEKYPQWPYIRSEGVGTILDYLGREVVGRPDDRSGVLPSRIQHPSNAEITQFNHPSSCEEHVLGFEISVEDLAIVHMLHSETHLCEPLKNKTFVHISASALFDLFLDVSSYGFNSSLPSA